MAKGNTVHLKMNRSFRTGRKLKGIADKAKRFDFKAIKDFNDLRSFFYEYSLFVGDISSLPGAPKMRIVSNMRHRFLKAGRLMGDAKAIGNTVKNLADGVQMSDFEGAGERYWRRFGGRMTGKALMTIPGSNIFARGARSVLGANMQKAFDAKTKQFFRKSNTAAVVGKTYGSFDFRNLTHNQKTKKVVEMFVEDIARQAYQLTPVKTGRLRGSLRTEMKEIKSKGGSLPAGSAKIGGGDINYAVKIEYGEGAGFDVGTANTKRYFPNTPTEAQALRSNKANRRAVNKASGKGAMMRRGATLAIKRLEATGLGNVLTDVKKNPQWEKVVKDALKGL